VANAVCKLTDMFRHSRLSVKSLTDQLSFFCAFCPVRGVGHAVA
jgi:hypothetical protein